VDLHARRDGDVRCQRFHPGGRHHGSPRGGLSSRNGRGLPRLCHSRAGTDAGTNA
jgi:hypothetical protein